MSDILAYLHNTVVNIDGKYYAIALIVAAIVSIVFFYVEVRRDIRKVKAANASKAIGDRVKNAIEADKTQQVLEPAQPKISIIDCLHLIQ